MWLVKIFIMLLPFSYLRRLGGMKKTTFYVEGGKIRDLLESTIPVKRIGNTYTFTEDIHGKITIQESDVVIDGNEYSLLGKGDQKAGDAGFGLRLREVRNVTIRDLKIKNFDFGVLLAILQTLLFLITRLARIITVASICGKVIIIGFSRTILPIRPMALTYIILQIMWFLKTAVLKTAMVFTFLNL
jgi:hypothetical protein